MKKSILISALSVSSLFLSGTVLAEACHYDNRQLIATVRSEGHTQKGQKHRSSGNFSTEVSGSHYTKFCWIVSDTKNPERVSFNVKRDKSAWTDPVEYTALKNGRVTTIKEQRSMYIADPSGTGGYSFTVTVYAVKP